jgi:hypothetical protein
MGASWNGVNACNNSSTILWHTGRMPADPFTLRQADQARTDFAIIEDDLEAIHKRLSQLPKRRDLAKYSFVLLFVGAMLGIVGIEAFWRYVPACGAP